MGLLNDRVVIVTGAGLEIGRKHALELAAANATLVLNEPAGPLWPSDSRERLNETLALVKKAGGNAVASDSDISTMEGANQLWRFAVEQFGKVHCLVNASGETRDRTLANMSVKEWDASVITCLHATFCTSAVAARYWRGLAKEGSPLQSVVVNRSSTSAMPGQPGQVNYAAAMSGVATLSIVASREGAQYGMRVNCLCGPMDAAALRAVTRMSVAPAVAAAPTSAKIESKVLSPVLVSLLREDCNITGQVMFIGPTTIRVLEPWSTICEKPHAENWSAADATELLSQLTWRSNDW